ncbi:hypothetical protein C3L33_10195, partial [Rhododendron williamsianum]
MTQLFFWAILGEMVMILILLFKTPLRNLAVMALSRLKQEGCRLVAKTVAGVVFVMMSTTVYNITEIHSRPMESLNPTDQILLGRHILEASLMGTKSRTPSLYFKSLVLYVLRYATTENPMVVVLEVTSPGKNENRFLLFLSLVIDRLHQTVEAAKKQNLAMEDAKSGSSDELKVLGEEISSLKTKIKQLESECESKGKEVKAAEADV